MCSGNGFCLDGVNGIGTCKCEQGFNGTACETCIEGKYGVHCDQGEHRPCPDPAPLSPETGQQRGVEEQQLQYPLPSFSLGSGNDLALYCKVKDSVSQLK